jgi:hypothetical protein
VGSDCIPPDKSGHLKLDVNVFLHVLSLDLVLCKLLTQSVGYFRTSPFILPLALKIRDNIEFIMPPKRYIWISAWFLISAPIILWDVGYVLMRSTSNYRISYENLILVQASLHGRWRLTLVLEIL